MSQLPLFNVIEPNGRCPECHEAVTIYEVGIHAAVHVPKAWYSATADGRVTCWRCRAIMERGEIKAHTAACWPEAGKPWDSRQRFTLGQVVATPGALELAVNLWPYLQRHQRGDWGDVGNEDAAANERALRDDGRLMSVYNTPAGLIWIITEADRASTCVLRPSEY